MKNTFLNIMAFITAACMVTITVFVILTAGAVKENSEKSLSKISDIEEQITAINERYEEEESASGIWRMRLMLSHRLLQLCRSRQTIWHQSILRH